MDQDRMFYEIDMERMYLDESFDLDQINAELQVEHQLFIDGKIEQMYDEWLDEIFKNYQTKVEDYFAY